MLLRVSARDGSGQANDALRPTRQSDVRSQYIPFHSAFTERAAENGLSNAVKYSPRGGNILVDVRREQDEAVLAVSDQGIGIPAQDLPHVFERYQRASNVVGRIAGSGLGLAGVRDVVEQHGGTIRAHSAEGQGTTMNVRLPLAESGLASALPPRPVSCGAASEHPFSD